MPRELGGGDFSQRTIQGIEALTASVKKVGKHPERVGFLGVAEVAAWARLFGWRRASQVLEPLVLPLLVGEPLRSRDRSGKKNALVGGLVAGGMASAEQVRVPQDGSLVGVAAVVANHGGYIAKLANKRARVSRPEAVMAGAAVAAGVVLAARKNPSLVPATLVGGAAAATTAALAGTERFRNRTTREAGIGHGANLILAAEGGRLLRNTVWKNNNGLGVRALEAGTLGVQAIGHMLLTDGLA